MRTVTHRDGRQVVGVELGDVSEPRSPGLFPGGVRQTTGTNCFRACVASVLGIGIGEVPEGCDGAMWDWDSFQDWLGERGMQCVEMCLVDGVVFYPTRKPVVCILTGVSPRECVTGRHAVVGEFLGVEGFRIVFDPHSSNDGLIGEPTHACFFVPVDPIIG